MRLLSWLAVACLAAGCGGGDDKAEQGKARGSSELTVTLPPTLPTQPACGKAEPQAGFETGAVAAPAPEVVPTPPKEAPAPKAA